MCSDRWWFIEASYCGCCCCVLLSWLLSIDQYIGRFIGVIYQEFEFLLMKQYICWCAGKLGWSAMRWRGVLVSLLYLAALGESTNRFSRFRFVNSNDGSSSLYNWTITSAGIFVAVSLVLSMFLIFEHLAAYNQPEVSLAFCFWDFLQFISWLVFY